MSSKKVGILIFFLVAFVLCLTIFSTIAVALCSPTERSCGCGGRQTRYTLTDGSCAPWTACSVAETESACVDGQDNDCDGKIDCADSDCGIFSSCIDADADGSSQEVDCDDSSAARFPGNVEVCDNLDNDCDGLIDESLVKQCGVSTVGICKYGTQSCSFGNWGECRGSVNPQAETCNGLDDDCDGQADEGCECTSGQSRTCGLTIGACKFGTQVCTTGVWKDCVGAVSPKTEECSNTIDDDCDGLVDEDCPTPSTQKASAAPLAEEKASKPTNVTDREVKQKIEQVESLTGCIDRDGDSFGLNCPKGADCDDTDPAVNPLARESCNAKDDNCNGGVDEALFLPCGFNRGICTAGMQACQSGVWSVCSGVQPKKEVCKNSLDDDCDGEIDEGCTIAQLFFADQDEEHLKRALDADLGLNYDFEEYRSYARESKNYINVKKSSVVADGKTLVKLEIFPIRDLGDVTVYEEIPKDVVDSTDKIVFKMAPRIIEKDPLIAWHFAEVKERIDLSYEIEGEHEGAHIKSKTTAFAKGTEPKKESLFVLLLPLLLIPALGFAVVLVAGLHKKN